ncbi:uncharacterized protein LDX57_008650 [Aspergillus melleus]|uniref:uncharacterized protein n=1 Tax=Aspergillus melleus TaxID=138277 RepID=UPI001E8E2E7A|nr:uncharacterized protein LDX57_008650 [Aspergillus melleus]KAH8430988.1 hypothetical protein LDX57_008650 [Aspergillus melleus]
MVHFLYTGGYETVNSPLNEGTSDISREYKKSVLIYHASKTYGLLELENLAKQKMKQLDEEVPILEVLQITRDIFPSLPAGEAWLPSYIEEKLQRLLAPEDLALGLREFYNILVRDHQFDIVVMKMIFEILSNRLLSMQDQHGKSLNGTASVYSLSEEPEPVPQAPSPEPGLAPEEPALASEEPEFASEEPEFAPQEPALASEEPEFASEEPEFAPQEPALASEEPEFASEEPEFAPQEPALASEEPEFASEEPEFAPQEPALASEEPEFASEEPEFAPQEPALASEEPEFASEEPEFAPQEPALASEEPEFASEEPEFAPQEPALASEEPAFASEEPALASEEPALVLEESEPVPTEPPAEEEFEQWTIPQVSPNTDGWPAASLSPSDTPNHEILPKALDQAQAQGHIARISCADLVLYQNWESLSSKHKKKRAVELASRGLPIPSEGGFISIVAI